MRMAIQTIESEIELFETLLRTVSRRLVHASAGEASMLRERRSRLQADLQIMRLSHAVMQPVVLGVQVSSPHGSDRLAA